MTAYFDRSPEEEAARSAARRLQEEAACRKANGEGAAGADGGGNGRRVVGITAAELDAKHFEPINWIVPDILAEGFSLLAGRVKLGKSWMAMDWAAGVAYGAFTMGKIACEGGDVLHLALEDNERRLQRRLKMLLGDTPKPERLEFNCRWPRLDEGGLEEIEAWIETVEQPRLIVIDVLKMIRRAPRNSEGAYDYDYASVEPLRELAGKHRLAVVGIHHLNKRYEGDDPFDLVSGSNGLAACADATLILNRDSNGCTLYGRGRDTEEFEKAVKFNPTTGEWTILGDADEVRRSDERRNIIQALKASSEPMGPSEIAAATGMAVNNVKQLLLKMAKSGEVEKEGYGRYSYPLTPHNSGHTDNSEGPERAPERSRNERKSYRHCHTDNSEGMG
jgi:hypothetical protein